MSGHCYDRAGKPISVEEMARLWSRWDYKHVARTKLLVGERPVFYVITIWVGFAITLGSGAADRRIFETTVFKYAPGDLESFPLDVDGPPFWRVDDRFEQNHYPDEPAAWAGHMIMVLVAESKVERRAAEKVRLEDERYAQPNGDEYE